MADYAKRSGAPAKRLSGCSPPANWNAPMRILPVLAVAAVALAGCNAAQGVSPSPQAAHGVSAGPEFPGYNPYDPISYAQTSGYYGGGHGGGGR